MILEIGDWVRLGKPLCVHLYGRNRPDLRQRRHRSRQLGVEIAMDDFGTGYSSLANLWAFQFSNIKIDQSFVRMVDQSPQSATIVRAVLGLGAGLNLPIVTEGVERPEEVTFLRGELCQSAQGYLFSPPRNITAFAAIVEGRSNTLGHVVPLRRTG